MKQKNEKEKMSLAPGELAFVVSLFLLGATALILSINLWTNAGENKLASAAALPMIASIIWVALTIYILIREIFSSKKNSKTFYERFKSAIINVFPKNILIAIIGIIAFCFVLLLGLNFYIASALFLWGLMSFLSNGRLVRNLIITSITVLILFFIFGLAFGVGLA